MNPDVTRRDVMNYTISYVGLDGVEHIESHTSSLDSVTRLVAFLEERGAHMISVVDDDGGVVYEQGAFVAFEERWTGPWRAHESHADWDDSR